MVCVCGLKMNYSDGFGACNRDRTGDLVLTKDVLYQLSYAGLRPLREIGDFILRLICEPLPRRSEGVKARVEPAFLWIRPFSIRATRSSFFRKVERETSKAPRRVKSFSTYFSEALEAGNLRPDFANARWGPPRRMSLSGKHRRRVCERFFDPNLDRSAAVGIARRIDRRTGESGKREQCE